MKTFLKIIFIIFIHFSLIFVSILLTPRFFNDELLKNKDFEFKIKKIEYTTGKKIKECKNINNATLIYQGDFNELYAYKKDKEIVICQK